MSNYRLIGQIYKGDYLCKIDGLFKMEEHMGCNVQINEAIEAFLILIEIEVILCDSVKSIHS